MGYVQSAGIDRQKETWHAQLKPLENKFSAVKPLLAYETPAEIAKWEEWRNRITRIKRSINIYTAHDGEAYLRITRTISELGTYIKARNKTIDVFNGLERDRRIMENIRLFHPEPKQNASPAADKAPTNSLN